MGKIFVMIFLLGAQTDVETTSEVRLCQSNPFTREKLHYKITCEWFFFDKQKTSHAGLSSPDDYIKELGRNDVSGEHLLKSLQSVRVSLTGRPLRYVGGPGKL